MKLEFRDTTAFVPTELLKAIVTHAGVKIDTYMGSDTAKKVFTSNRLFSDQLELITEAVMGEVAAIICPDGNHSSLEQFRAKDYAKNKLYLKKWKMQAANNTLHAMAKPALPGELENFFGESAGKYSALTREYDLSRQTQSLSPKSKTKGYPTTEEELRELFGIENAIEVE